MINSNKLKDTYIDHSKGLIVIKRIKDELLNNTSNINNNIKKSNIVVTNKVTVVKCQSCGAKNIIEDERIKCEYCGSPLMLNNMSKR